MSAFVHTGWGDHTFVTGEDYLVDPAGNLVISTGRCQPVATFAAGYWKYVTITPNRDSKGRFAKRSQS